MTTLVFGTRRQVLKVPPQEPVKRVATPTRAVTDALFLKPRVIIAAAGSILIPVSHSQQMALSDNLEMVDENSSVSG